MNREHRLELVAVLAALALLLAEVVGRYNLPVWLLISPLLLFVVLPVALIALAWVARTSWELMKEALAVLLRLVISVIDLARGRGW
ncbi:hypothetical protein GPA19_05255 [Azoarcus indigens]|uniref:Uncharacterized protein n=1 Tax=Azoarcus indigens TaxID=29545 RepID=A0A4R6DVC8_9RHOO|nr:hypothetical protein [Azoarcus indigens]NMG64352.1 hypothetical protein [Azoarcus indigens]TDN49196.1 hypothetical protein C7389_11247 [Azoarcus indigens]